MTLYEFEGKRPTIHPTAFVPDSADVIGDVVIGAACFVGVGARLRGDYGRIRIGERTSVQENVVIHARENGETVVGSNVQLGHGCILHNCTVRDNAVIGLGAILTDFSVVGDWAIVGEVTAEHKAEWQYYKDKYAELAATRYPTGLKRIG
jgi:carbonic anhydrase/acetyltransferase-like protein (isoleucine patch superfamily)